MAKEILLYGSIESYSVADFINSINEIESGDLTVRVNSNGGSPEYGFGMIAKFREFQGKKVIKVDGKAHSMALFFLAYADNVEALDVSEFLLHRAAYPSWFESSPEYFGDEVKSNLERMNANLQKAFESKIDVAKFEELKGIKLKDIFSMDSRKEVYLTAKEAKKIGLINTITQITPKIKSEIESYMAEITAKSEPNNNKIENQKIENNMTLVELKEKHPALYAEILTIGATAEKSRVGAWLVFVDVDAKAVAEGVESGNEITSKNMAEFSRKQFSAELLAKQETEATATTTTVEPPKTEMTAKEKELEAFEKELGIK